MPYSGRAPAQDGLRLRPRRARSERSQLLSVQFLAVLVLVGGGIGFVVPINPDAFSLPALHLPGWMPGPAAAPPAPLPSTDLSPSPEEQQYLAALRPVHVRLEQSVVRIGLLAAVYQSREIDPAELKRGLDDGLTTYRQVEEQVRALQPPPELQQPHDHYLGAVRLLQQSALELLKMVDDGDEGHVVRAMPMTVEGTIRLRTLTDRLWPTV